MFTGSTYHQPNNKCDSQLTFWPDWETSPTLPSDHCCTTQNNLALPSANHSAWNITNCKRKVAFFLRQLFFLFTQNDPHKLLTSDILMNLKQVYYVFAFTSGQRCYGCMCRVNRWLVDLPEHIDPPAAFKARLQSLLLHQMKVNHWLTDYNKSSSFNYRSARLQLALT